jgi:putative ABC transport system permease protein
MNWIAIRMLMGDRAKYLGIIAGVTFAALLIAQQVSIACGVVLRSTAQLQDIADIDVWVLDPSVEYIETLKPLTEGDLSRVQGVPGVAWAVRFYKGQGRIKLGVGGQEKAEYQHVIVMGLDDSTLVGAPREVIVGSLADLRRPDAVIMDVSGYKYLWPDEPLRVGRVLEMNDRRAVLVGICKTSETFFTMPLLYTRYQQAIQFVPQERKVMSAVLVGVEEGQDPHSVCRRIEAQTAQKMGGLGLRALTRDEFIWVTLDYFMRRTGIVANFAIMVTLGFIVGCAVAGQTFYSFTLENLKQFGSLKAMGVTNGRIVGMVLVQATLVGSIGYGLGVGLAAVFGTLATSVSRLAFYMPWQVLVATGAAVAVIVTLSSVFSVYKVLVLEPAVVFRG